MKKLYVLLITLALISCSSDNEPLPQEQSTDKPIEQPEEKPTEPTVKTKGQFIFKNITYDVTTGSALTVAQSKNVSSTLLSLVNLNNDQTETVIIQLTIFHKTTKTNISGTYQLGDWRDETGIDILDKGLTGYEIFVTSSDGKTLLEHYSNGLDRTNLKEGVLTITENGNDNYTIKYNLLFENGMTSSANTTVNLLTKKM